MRMIKDLEGELTIDHRNSPGVPADMLAKVGLPAEAGRGLYHAPIYTCGHCQRGVPVIVGAFGAREKRYVCRGCSHVICEGCAREKALTGVCVPFEAKVHAYLESVEKQEQVILLK
jgi:hypothetical protein